MKNKCVFRKLIKQIYICIKDVMHDNPYASRTVRRSWIQRNPRLFSSLTITTAMLILFSRPIYDAFIRDDLVPAPPRVRK